ncbi:MAG: TRAP transporter small permease [Rhodospirillaceae bacterium]|nr:TRAP transporter small permease [Rhodospirillaceae bacterium]
MTTKALSGLNSGINSLFDKVILFCAALAGILIMVVCAITFYEVVARYLFNAPTTWSIDISTYAMFWACFLGGAYTLREGGHVAVDVVVRGLDDTYRRSISRFVFGLVALFAGLVAWRGGLACVDAYEVGEVTMSVLRFPLYVPMLAVPVGGTLIAAQALMMATKGQIVGSSGESA